MKKAKKKKDWYDSLSPEYVASLRFKGVEGRLAVLTDELAKTILRLNVFEDRVKRLEWMRDVVSESHPGLLTESADDPEQIAERRAEQIAEQVQAMYEDARAEAAYAELRDDPDRR